MNRWLRSRRLQGLIGATLLGSVLVAQNALQPEPIMGGADSRGTALVLLQTREWKLRPEVIQLEAGQPVVLRLENKGEIEHIVQIRDTGIVLRARPGETARATFRPSQPGTYEIECAQPAHQEHGMRGHIIVTAGPGADPG
ncbi:MAG: cupredoxin domain-containing protein [Chloroflexi bacterium]|nr:cupredoxin domain-containing protein [Chloroflexota bacterium]